MSSKRKLQKYYNKELCKNFRLPEDFLELNALDYFFIYLRFMREVYGDSLDEEKLKEQFKEQVLNESQSQGLKTTEEDL